MKLKEFPQLETKKNKFADDDAVYFEYMRQLDGLYDDAKEIIYNFPVYVGAVNIARFLSLYEIYREVVDKSGHIADVGTYKGASMMFLAKLIKLFEPHSQTEVHGFDWFKGMQPGSGDDSSHESKYVADKGRLEKLIEVQGLYDIARLHDLDLTRDLGEFFDARPWVRYKLVFLDCGMRSVMEAALKYFWPRLVVGGIVILDHFNNESSPSESEIIGTVVSDAEMLQKPYSRSPTAYLIKRGARDG
jgi:methyltransferase family protein